MENDKLSRSRLTIIALAICLLLSASACFSFEWHYEEIERFTSPDGMVDVVWVRGNGGATTGFVYSMYLVPKGLKFDKDATSFKHAAFAGDHFIDLKAVWKEPKLLEIRYRQARIVRFTNYWYYWNPDDPKVDSKYVVELKLVPLTDGSALSEADRRLK